MNEELEGEKDRSKREWGDLFRVERREEKLTYYSQLRNDRVKRRITVTKAAVEESERRGRVNGETKRITRGNQEVGVIMSTL